MASKNFFKTAAAVLFTFFVMGFCDVVGIATSYVKVDFNLSESLAGIIPSMLFFWFLVFAVPSAMLMNKLGRKKMVQISNIVTIVAMMIPFISYSFATCMVAFILLGIGNTILQVSLNPLLTNVVKGDTLTSSLTAGQVIKAVSSFCGPLIAAFALTKLGSWMYLFPIFAAITFISWIWLCLTPIEEEDLSQKATSYKEVFGLLGDTKILILFLGIFCVVGVDVGTNTVAPKLLMERVGWEVKAAGFGSSVYFVCRTAGALLGTLLLMKMSDSKYFVINIFAALAALLLLFFAKGEVAILAGVGLLGFFCSSIFTVIYSTALKMRPDKVNEISGLLITGICGGAAIPPLMGLCADAVGSQTGSLIVIGVVLLYLVWCSLWVNSKMAKTK